MTAVFKQDRDNFINNLRFQLQNSNLSATEPSVNNDEQQLEDRPPKKVAKTSNFRVKATDTFI